MAFEITFDEQQQIGILRAFDVSGPEEWQPTVEAVLNHPQITRGVPVLFDFLKVNYVPTSQSSREIVDGYIRMHNELASPMAIVIDNDGKYGVARMIETVSGLRGARLRVFTDRDEAIAWLVASRAAK